MTPADPAPVEATERHPSLPARRTVLVSAAWAAPVVLLAGAAPFAAASQRLAAVITFERSSIIVDSGDPARVVRGTVEPAGADALVAVYSEGYGGPSTVPVDPKSGVFELFVACPVGEKFAGTVTLSAREVQSNSVTLTVTGARPDTGTISWSPTQADGTLVKGVITFPVLTGSVSVSPGNRLAAYVLLSYPEGWSGPETDEVVQLKDKESIGTFSVTGVQAVEGVKESATLTAAPENFQEKITFTPKSAGIVLVVPTSPA